MSPSRTRASFVALACCVLLVGACAERVTSSSDLWAPGDILLGMGAPAAELTSTPWTLRALDDSSFAADTTRTLRFSAHTASRLQLGATVGCNGIGGTADTVGTRLRVDGLLWTERWCGDALGELERRLISALTATAYFGVRGDTLWLYDGALRRRARLEARR